ncbi:MAG: tRNA (adenosine(37)-N6)-threonylcarbamoyltransferase complex dimerization subunit type 1 TsaB [Anaerolineaceae bacterium]|nr:tRNA (adenosine(37)-N6)-threonylcarbamoyltransferase complex dimerization subunit type 1 TsaB [Anaerolineaceae bacterium]
MNSGMLLAIDSATHCINLALHDGHEVIAEHSWRSAKHHSAGLPPMVERMLTQGGPELAAMAVAAGPGSFTGLRIGVAFAKGLAAARSIPLVAVSTQDILAAALPPCPDHALLILLSAGRKRYIASRFLHCKGRWQANGDETLTDLETLLRPPMAPTCVAGELDACARDRLARAQAAGSPLQLASPALSLRRAGFLAEIAHERLREGAPDDFDPGMVTARYIATRDTP